MPALSVQLYSLRAAIESDLPTTIKRVADIGFTRVEPYNFVSTVDALAAALDANNLTAPSAHAHLLDGNEEDVFKAAQRLGVTTVVHPHVDPEKWRSAGDIRATAEALNTVAAKAADHGLRIGYHNHWFELEFVLDGRTGLEILAEALDPNVVLELDTYWAAAGGQDVVALLGRLGDRVRLLHVKDGPIQVDPATQVAVGSGAMPIWDIIAAAKSLEVPVVELDDFAADMFDALSDSFDYLSAGQPAPADANPAATARA
ncbi:MAG: sugar phosphate isomerase/epimerase [Microbacteriaceae bacterium]